MTYAALSLADRAPAPYSAEVDPEWADLLPRLLAVLPKTLARAAVACDINYGYFWALVNGERNNPSPDKRQRILAYVLKREGERRPEPIVSGSEKESLQSDPGSALRDTMNAPVLPLPQNPASEARIHMPTPTHAALYELLSMLPAAIILKMIPDAVKRVEDYLRGQNGAPSPEKK